MFAIYIENGLEIAVRVTFYGTSSYTNDEKKYTYQLFVSIRIAPRSRAEEKKQ